MFRARATWFRFKLTQSKPLCTKTNNNNNNNTDNNKIQSNLIKYDQQYRQLDKLDFMTAAKILFTDPPKTKKFGIDFHLVQLFFACMPSLAVFLVAQYARYEMRKMDAELEQKKKQEEEKAKEMELKAAEEKEAGPQLLEVKVRLDKLEEAVKEIAVESKKQSGRTITKNQEDGNEKKHLATNEPGNNQSISESSNSVEKDQLSKQKSAEPTPSLNQGKESGSAPVPNSSQQDQKGKTQNGGPSQDAKR